MKTKLSRQKAAAMVADCDCYLVPDMKPVPALVVRSVLTHSWTKAFREDAGIYVQGAGESYLMVRK